MFIKNALEINKDTLTSEEKRTVLLTYMNLWVRLDCELDIADTEYKDDYKSSRFGTDYFNYNAHVPMVAGFCLRGADLTNVDKTDCIFLSVDFTGANLWSAKLGYSHFENCNFSNITANNTNFGKCRFVKCNLAGVNLGRAGLCEVCFDSCDLDGTEYRKRDDILITNKALSAGNKEPLTRSLLLFSSAIADESAPDNPIASDLSFNS